MPTDVPPPDDLFPTKSYEAARPDARQFQPWHRPRKQFVRDKQWAREVAALFREQPIERPLRYLGLPGPDLLDLRHLHSELCNDGARPLLFLGFNRAAPAAAPGGVQLHSSLDEVRRLGNVDGRSDVIPDDFRSLARKGSPGYRSALEMAPFDVINIDLCDGLLRDEPAGVATDHTMYDAFAQALALQQRNEDPWVLMLTSRMGSDHEDPNVLSKLATSFADNLENCDGFGEACADLVGTAQLPDLELLDPAGRFNLVSAYICKWLLHMLTASNCAAEVASSARYQVNEQEGAPDLLSLVVRVHPRARAVSDRSGLARPAPEVDECTLARKMVERLQRMIDIDAILADDQAVWDAAVGASATLLASAHYNPDDYRAWVAESHGAPVSP